VERAWQAGSVPAACPIEEVLAVLSEYSRDNRTWRLTCNVLVS
jgi:hypothetical protein